VRVTVVGSSPAWPNPGSAHTGTLVEADGGRLLVDCGPGVLSRLREREDDWPHVDAIVVTHCHLDHCGDLVPWLWGRLMGPARNEEVRTPLWLPPGGRAAVQALASGESLDGVFAVHEYADRQAFETAGLTVRPIRVAHFDAVAFGVRISDGEKTVAFSGDSGPSTALAELADGAHLFVCEATSPDGVPAGPARGHLSAAEALAAGEGALRVLLTHRPVELPAPAGAEVARDGLTIDL
jgi:ribonuclease BN (tRNA processing enzyme)